jgi:Transcription elongation factor
MNLVNLGERKLSQMDFSRLSKLGGQVTGPLADLLDEAEILDHAQMPADIVTLYAQVEVQHLGTQRRQALVLCSPAQSDPASGHISVLSPVGLALLGLKVGSVARWRSPSGEESAAEVLSVLLPPEDGAAPSQ